jgi:E3 ubiquitin ligase
LITAFAVAFSAQIVTALAALLGLCLLLRGLLLFAGKPKFDRITSIGRVSLGPIQVHGTAAGPYTITGPISGKSCYLYRTAVWQQRSRADGWEKLVEETLHVPFFVEDPTGQLLIEPMGADLEIRVTLREEHGGLGLYAAAAIPPAVNAFLSRHRVTPTNRFLIEEFCIEPETELFVTGVVTKNPGIEIKPAFPKKANGAATNAKETPQPDAPEIVRLSDTSASLPSDAMTQQSKIAAALAKAGINNPNAWAAAGVPYPGQGSGSQTAVLHEERSPSDQESPKATGAVAGFDLNPRLVLMKEADAPFVLSSHRTEPAGPSWQDVILLGVGAALTLASLWIALKQLL